MIPRETVEEILLRTDIQTLIGGYVSLKRAGSNLKGLCPFHSEKTPSFTVYPGSSSFYCFGCGAGGDQISFVMRMEHMDYPDAVKLLGKRAGITVNDTDEAYNSGPKIDRNRIYALNTEAARYYNRCLFADNPNSKTGLAYFTEKRKLSPSIIKHFGLGYAPNSFNAFSDYMLSRGYTYDELLAADLVAKNEKGYYYDVFRNKVMFPIIDVSGNVIAFGGRVLDNSKPKYRNSSDTPVFKKLRNLFALNFARHTCEDLLILCEGYMDVIALHAVGITNAVATLGTAITSEQARVMSRYTKKVLISYDSDEAGQKATARALIILEEVGLEVGILSIPDAKDPDEYIRTFGVEKFKSFLEKPKTKFEYNLETVLSKYDITAPQGKINALSEIENMISRFYSVAERDVYIKSVADKFGVEFSSIKADVDRIVAKNFNAYKRGEAKRVQQQAVGYADRINPDYIKAPAVARNEEALLSLLLLYPEHRKKVFDERLVSEEDFYTELNKRIFTYIHQCFLENDERMVNISEIFSADEMGRIARMKQSRMCLSANGTDVLIDAIAQLKRSRERKENESINTVDGLVDLIEKKRKKDKEGLKNE